MLDSMERGFWLGWMVLDALGYFWFITLPLLLLAAAAWMRVPDGEPRRFRAGWIVLAVQGGAVVLLLALGAFGSRPAGREPLAWAGGFWFLTLLAAFVTTGRLVVVSKGNRFLVLGTGLFGLWTILFTAFITGMAVSGEWL